MSAPACSATSSVSRVDRPQILTIKDMFQGTGWAAGPDRAGNAAGSTTSRPACLARRPHIRRPAGPERCRGSYRERRAARTQIRQLRPRLPRIGFVLARRAPPAPLPEPGRRATRHHTRDRHRDDHDEQRQPPPNRWIAGIERIKRHRHQMTIGDRKHDEDQAQQNQHQSREEFSHDHLSRCWRSAGAFFANAGPVCDALGIRAIGETPKRRLRERLRRGSAVRAFPCRS